ATSQTYALTRADVGSTIRVQETATNTAGASDPATSSQTAVVVSSGGGGGSPPSSPPPPMLTGLSLTYTVFAVANGPTPLPGTAAAHHKGTTFRFALNEAATVRIVITSRLPGRTHGKRCAALTRKLRHAKACTRTVKSGTLTRTGDQGANAVAFS